jgi:hypothetical protein
MMVLVPKGLKLLILRPYLFLCLAVAIASSACGKISPVAPQPTTGAQQDSLSPFPGTLFPPRTSSVDDTWENIHLFQVFDGGITKQQATAHAFRYGLVWGTSKPEAWTAGNSNIVTSWYAPFNGDFTTHHDLTWWKANHPDWILYKCDQRTPAGMGGLTNVPLDISSRAVVKWQMTNYAPSMENGGYDAFAGDLVGLSNAGGGCGVWINGAWHQRFTGAKEDDAWAQAVLAWHRYAFSYLHSLPRPLALAVNNVPENRPFGDPEEDELLNNVDFVDDESSFTNYGNGYASDSRVQLIVQWMKYVQGLNKTYIVDDKWNTQKLTRQQFEWAAGTYLLGKYHHASVFIDHLPGYGYEYWFPQYRANIGHPCGDMYPDLLKTGVFYRKYSHGFVVVNATFTKNFVVRLPLPTYTSIWGDIVLSPVKINADDSQVLLTSLNGCL